MVTALLGLAVEGGDTVEETVLTLFLDGAGARAEGAGALAACNFVAE